MASSTPRVEFINEFAEKLKEKDLIHLTTDAVSTPNRRMLTVDGQELLNFTSCSYLGLETDERLKLGAMNNIEKYGVQFDCSRAYVSLHPYFELESLLSQVFGKPVVVFISVTSGHLSCMQSLIDKRDAIILDHQVHTSVTMAVNMVKATGVHVEMIRHNRMDYLENRVKKLSANYRRIWYMADGVYSMSGDIAPVKDIYALMDQYDQLYTYIDDAHGMSWTGKNGSGAVLSKAPFHPKLLLLTSLGKAFGSSGGVAVFPNEDMKKIVRNVGNTLIFTSPLTPPVLGAATASAKIHLSNDILPLQTSLQSRIEYFRTKARELGLPLVSNGESPVFFIGTGKPEPTLELAERLRKEGIFVCIAVYPSVPYSRSGIRLMASLYHSFEDIDTLLETLSRNINEIFKRENIIVEELLGSFGAQHLLT